MGVVVYTAIIGPQTDALRAPLVVDPRARYLCFSDRPVHVPPYEWIEVPSAEDPRLASRSYKVRADHPLVSSVDYLLWHDSSYQLTCDVRWVPDHLQDSDLCGLRHKKKRTLEREAERIALYGYLTNEKAAAHVQRYREAGFKRKGAVTCGGLLARRRSARMDTFNRRWWDEVQRWGGRDQASLHYVAWLSNIVVGYLKGQIRDNAFAQWRESGVTVPA